MKKIFLSFLSLTAVLVTSCSDDNSSPTDSNSSPLVSSTQKVYDNGVVEEIFKTEYDNGRITKINSLTPENVLKSYDELSYNSNGLLSAVNTYLDTSLYASTIYSYDSQGRMTDVNFLSIPEQTAFVRSFAYNSSTGTIVSTTSNSGAVSKTFYVNSAGYVYKEEQGDSTYELTFNDTPNPVSANYNGTITTFEYDNEHNPSLININIGTGSFKPNAVLRANSLADSTESLRTKYLTKESADSAVTKYVYTFNEQGLPTKMMEYYNDVLQSETEYFYN